MPARLLHDWCVLTAVLVLLTSCDRPRSAQPVRRGAGGGEAPSTPAVERELCLPAGIVAGEVLAGLASADPSRVSSAGEVLQSRGVFPELALRRRAEGLLDEISRSESPNERLRLLREFTALGGVATLRLAAEFATARFRLVGATRGGKSPGELTVTVRCTNLGPYGYWFDGAPSRFGSHTSPLAFAARATSPPPPPRPPAPR